MSIYRIYDFSDGPHWDTALVEATSPKEAEQILRAEIDRWIAEDDKPETVWNWQLPEEGYSWYITKETGPIFFLMGKGCR